MKVTETIPSKTYTLPTYKKVDGVLVPEKSVTLKFADEKHEGVDPKDVIIALVMFSKSKEMNIEDKGWLLASLQEVYDTLNK